MTTKTNAGKTGAIAAGTKTVAAVNPNSTNASGQIILRGIKSSDRTPFVKVFNSQDNMTRWLTTAEADDYDFE
jgi:hypothetical protein